MRRDRGSSFAWRIVNVSKFVQGRNFISVQGVILDTTLDRSPRNTLSISFQPCMQLIRIGELTNVMS